MLATNPGWQLWSACKKTLVVISFLALAGCGGKVDADLTPAPSPSLNASHTPAVLEKTTDTPVPTPTATDEPLAAVVNGEAITLAAFQGELKRFQQARETGSGMNLATEERDEETIVIQAMIDELLLTQGASKAGFVLEESALESRYQELSAQTDLPGWLQENGYTEASFRAALAHSIEAVWMRDQVMLGVPAAVEQVHARQILLYNQVEANQVHASLQSGVDFDKIAALYDPVGTGDIGWFPRGYLTEPAVEEAAFDLQPGEISTVIETRLGFHIIKVLERDPERTLEPDALLALQTQAVQNWLEESRAQSEIQLLLP